MEKWPFPGLQEWLHLTDLLQVMRKKRKMIVRTVWLSIFVGILFALLGRVDFVAKGTFQDKNKKNASVDTTLLSFIGLEDPKGEAEGLTMMLSRKLLERVIDDLHLQGDIVEKRNIFSKIVRRVRNNVLTEHAYLTRRNVPILPEHSEPIVIKELHYTGAYPRKYHLSFNSDETFVIYEGKTNLGKGILGERFFFPDGQGIIQKQEETSVAKKNFTLRVTPLSQQAEKWQDRLKVKKDDTRKQMLQMVFRHPDRYVAAAIVNRLMDRYCQYLEEQHQEQSTKQIEYLQKRRGQSHHDLEEKLANYAKCQREGISTAGIVETEKEIEFLTEQLQLYKDRLLANELDVLRLEKAQKKEFVYFDPYTAQSDANNINTLLQDIRSLKQQRDDIHYVLLQRVQKGHEEKKRHIVQCTQELEQVHKKMGEVTSLLNKIESGMPISTGSSLVEDTAFLVGFWIDIWLQSPDRDRESNKEHLVHYLRNLVRLFRRQEDTLTARLIFEQEKETSLQGISLESAQTLFFDLCQQKSLIETDEKSYVFLKEALADTAVEIHSLSHIVTDEVVDQAIRETRLLFINAHDQGNRSVREQERFAEDIALQRHFLQEYVQQTQALLVQKKEILDEKIFSLRKVMLDLLHQQIALYENHLTDYLLTRRENLQQDRSVLEGHVQQIQDEMALLPDKWVAEQLVHEELTMQRRLVEELTKIVESKNILFHLEMIQSQPIDRALVPIQARYPGVVLWIVIGGMIGLIGSISFLLVTTVRSGLPLSKEGLESRSLPFAGTFSGYQPGEIIEEPVKEEWEVLRHMIHLIGGRSRENKLSPLRILCVEGKGPHYTPLLAQLYAKMGKKVLVIALSVREEERANDGLFAYLERKIPLPTIEEMPYGGFIAAGEQNLFVSELLQSEDFARLLKRVDDNYDVVLAYSAQTPASAEIPGMATLFPFCVLTYTDEIFHDVEPLVSKAIFVTTQPGLTQ